MLPIPSGMPLKRYVVMGGAPVNCTCWPVVTIGANVTSGFMGAAYGGADSYGSTAWADPAATRVQPTSTTAAALRATIEKPIVTRPPGTDSAHANGCW